MTLMDLREYSFVKNGPDCVCHHSRADHVGWHARYEMETWDIHCQVPGCTSCPELGYWPLGPLNFSVLMEHDRADREAVNAIERVTTRRLRIVGLTMMWGSVAVSIGASIANNVWDRMGLAVLLAIVSLTMLGGYAMLGVKTVMRLDPPRGLMLAAMTVPIPVLALGTVRAFVDIPWAWYVGWCIVLLSTALILFGIEHRRAMKRFARSTKRMQDDMEMMRQWDQWDPLAVIGVRIEGDQVTVDVRKPDANEEPNGSAPRPSQ